MNESPLTWPVGVPRTLTPRPAAFRCSLTVAAQHLQHQVALLCGPRDAATLVISSNMRYRRDGMPYAQQPNIDDHGVAVYFTWRGVSRVFACDRWNTCADNVRAIGLTIEALRGIDRWGTSDMLERVFTGFQALPNLPPDATPSAHWSVILGCAPDATPDEIEAAYRRAVKKAHPDHGGSETALTRVRQAREQAKR